MKQLKRLFFLLVVATLLPVHFVKAEYSGYIPTWQIEKNKANPVNVLTPTLTVSNYNTMLLQGLCAKNTEVLIYVDGNYDGLARIQESGSEQNNFYYTLSSTLKKGKHNVKAIARDKTSLRLSIFSKPVTVYVNKVDAPTLIDVKEINNNFVLVGLSANNTYLRVYVDGKYDGRTGILHDKSGTANFAYTIKQKFSTGIHKVYAVSVQNNLPSDISNSVYFESRAKLPAPTLVGTVINKNTDKAHPFITGLTKNNTVVEIYINNKLDGVINVKNDKSGTANFAYKPKQELNNRICLIYAIAKNKKGEKSIKSNPIFCPYSKNNKKISKQNKDKNAEHIIEKLTEATKNKKETQKTTEKNIKKTESQTEKTTEKEEVLNDTENGNISDNAVQEKASPENTEKNKEIINIDTILGATGTDGTSTQNSEQNNQGTSNIKLNLIVFIAFLIAVIAWIFWVNKELIKEKKESAMEEEEEEENNKK